MNLFEMSMIVIPDNPKVSQTMRDVVDGTIELVLRDNGKTTSSSSPRSSPCNEDFMPVGFSLIFVEDEFNISQQEL
mgnify:CR=1 FL=1|jgi:hypothetical protein